MELFEILNLAQRYQVDELKNMVSGHINNFPLTLDNVVMVAASAEEQSHFEEVSTNLVKSCVDLLSAKMVDVSSVLSFISNNEDGATVQKLLKELGVKTKTSKKQACDNCGKKPCRNKSKITNFNDLTPGQVIQTTNSTAWLDAYRLQVCRVVSVSRSGARVAWMNLPNRDNPDESRNYPSSFHDKFTYMCDK